MPLSTWTSAARGCVIRTRGAHPTTRTACVAPLQAATASTAVPVLVTVSRSRSSNEKINYKYMGLRSFCFSNTQMREIERQNQILLRKMMTDNQSKEVPAPDRSGERFDQALARCYTQASSDVQMKHPVRQPKL